MEPESVLLEGILALQRGERERAGALLVRYTRTTPESAEGWLWLSRCLDNPKEIEYCLRKAHNIDPALADSFQAKPVTTSGEVAVKSQAGAAASPHQPGFRLSALSANGKRAVWIGVIALVLIAAAGGWWYASERKAERARLAPLVFEARPLIENCGDNCDYEQAAGLLDEVIKGDPDRAEARYLRSVALLHMAEAQYDPEQSLEQLNRARDDIDRFIAVTSPPNGRDYAVRYRIYHALAMRQDLRANAEQLLRIAMENLFIAGQLGDKSIAQLDAPLLFIQLGMCDEGLAALERQQEEQPQENGSAIVMEWESIWKLSCENDLAGAQEALTLSRNFYPLDLRSNDTRAFEGALIDYLSGDSEAALAKLDDLIAERPDGGGERYYLRSLILYEQGYYDLAEEDLLVGEENTWQRGGLDAYVRYLMALDAAQDEEALRQLQLAEASMLPGIYSPMIDRFQMELEDFGAIPLEQTPSAPLRATPIAIEE